ncbi:hypothetical protein RUND412_002495 [Rhizina undulata]
MDQASGNASSVPPTLRGEQVFLTPTAGIYYQAANYSTDGWIPAPLAIGLAAFTQVQVDNGHQTQLLYVPIASSRVIDSMTDEEKAFEIRKAIIASAGEFGLQGITLSDGTLNVVKIILDPIPWLSNESPALQIQENQAVGMEVYHPEYQAPDFAQLLWSLRHEPRFVNPYNMPLDTIVSKMRASEIIGNYLKGLNPVAPDPPMTDEIFYPPTRRCNPETLIPRAHMSCALLRRFASTLGIPAIPRRLWYGHAPSGYPIPKNFDGSQVEFPKHGHPWLYSAWEYDIFPIYYKSEGLYWDYRCVHEVQLQLPITDYD